MSRILLIGCMSALFVFGCADFEPVHLVTKFKVLAVSAEPPEISPGDGTTLRVLWADPQGEGREVQFAWVLCGGLIHASEGLSFCEIVYPPWIETASNGGDTLVVPATPTDLLEDLPPGEDRLFVTAVVIMCAGGELPSAEELIEKADVPNINTLCEGGDGLSSFKAVLISNSEDPNTNPAIEYLELEGTPLDSVDNGGLGTIACNEADKCGTESKIGVFMTEDSFQTFDVEEFGNIKTVDEDLYVSWFTTGGEYNADRSGSDEVLGPYEVTWKPENEGAYTLYAVAHDTRGGVSWQTYSVETNLIPTGE